MPADAMDVRLLDDKSSVSSAVALAIDAGIEPVS